MVGRRKSPRRQIHNQQHDTAEALRGAALLDRHPLREDAAITGQAYEGPELP